MCPTDYEPYYVRHLPHVQPSGGTFFVTCRLAGSLPRHIQAALRDQRNRCARELDRISDESARKQQTYLKHRMLFGQWDTALARSNLGPMWLNEAVVANLVTDSLHHRDSTVYGLLAYCLMPNHLHIVFRPLADRDNHYPSVTAIMQSFKGYTAYECNKILDRKGQFWQRESYDHCVRDEEELMRIIKYVINNPVKARLTDCWQDWPWTYCKYLPQMASKQTPQPT